MKILDRLIVHYVLNAKCFVENENATGLIMRAYTAGFIKGCEMAADVACPHDNWQVVDKACCRDKKSILALGETEAEV